jgi:uncharacterized protein (TIGR00288 family)
MRLVEKGKLVAKKAYCDWSRFAQYTASLHEAAVELVEIPKRGQTGKNSADIRLVVDAIDLAYSKEHIDTFVIVSGDSDFSPLVSKLKELGKHVIGLGMEGSTSNLLRDNCDEFIYYEDLNKDVAYDKLLRADLPEMKQKGFLLLISALAALRRENKETLWSSMVKDTMKRMRPSFNETYHGYKSFSEMLEDARREGLLSLETDEKSGTYVVSDFKSEFSEAAGGRSRSPQPSGPRPPPRRHAPPKAPVPPKAPAATAEATDDEPAAAGTAPQEPEAKPAAKRRSRGGRGRGGRGRGKKTEGSNGNGESGGGDE